MANNTKKKRKDDTRGFWSTCGKNRPFSFLRWPQPAGYKLYVRGEVSLDRRLVKTYAVVIAFVTCTLCRYLTDLMCQNLLITCFSLYLIAFVPLLTTKVFFVFKQIYFLSSHYKWIHYTHYYCNLVERKVNISWGGSCYLDLWLDSLMKLRWASPQQIIPSLREACVMTDDVIKRCIRQFSTNIIFIIYSNKLNKCLRLSRFHYRPINIKMHKLDSV